MKGTTEKANTRTLVSSFPNRYFQQRQGGRGIGESAAGYLILHFSRLLNSPHYCRLLDHELKLSAVTNWLFHNNRLNVFVVKLLLSNIKNNYWNLKWLYVSILAKRWAFIRGAMFCDPAIQ